ncbi:SDR family NAD(P)-dependent oxidoreductase [Campylobacter lari]|uniref:SDR family NAD(P)-dependent oxidoreductase n=1 Tax=Campylobacter lari TaxID=201 RepID=UPI00214A383B|nr:SDR family NAD(P)-dependent oxidoreductase [Campylobacter lari]MCR2074846.1 SDR family NAD(P)-dependent oxidoreductase [Campylobacter lari subsp. concheus]
MVFKERLFENKNYTITSASSGIGAHISLVLNKLGVKIIAIGRDNNKLLSQKKQAENPDNFITISKDLSEFEDLDKWILKLSEKYGSFNETILAIGIAQPLGINSPYYTNNTKQIFNINYFGNLQILKGLISKKAKIKDETSFIWISSTTSKTSEKKLNTYGVSKAAINTTVKSITLEIAPKYRINSILPGFTKPHDRN